MGINPGNAITTASGGTENANIVQVGSVNVPTSLADAISNSTSIIPVESFLLGYNGATWDRITSTDAAGGSSASPTKGALTARAVMYGIVGGTNIQGISARSDPSNNLGLNVTATQYATTTGTDVVALRTPIKFITLNAVSIASETTIWTPAAGKKFRLMGFLLTQGTLAGNVVLKDNTAGTTIFIVPASLVSTPINAPNMGNGILSAAANNVLTATGSATQTLSGTIWGTEE